ncbi:MAG: hypothetical protein ABIS50_02885 [Luteolibacter sp.]|uniref:hypothetical protein n=1 Tax=Luteolibacter sp. TaxID=1962973 RepID=UPI003263E2B4
MKILRLLLLAACVTSMAPGASLELDGDLSWGITEPQCTFTLQGDLRNITPTGESNTLKLVLWATPEAYPSPGRAVAEYFVGRLKAGAAFSDFKIRTRAIIPDLTGDFHFTLTVREETTENDSGWADRLILPGPVMNLTHGDFTDQRKWQPRERKVSAPPKDLVDGQEFVFTPKATLLLNLLPVEGRIPTRVRVGVRNRVRVTFDGLTDPATYTYGKKPGSLNDEVAPSARFKLDQKISGSDSDTTGSDYILYFQGKASGTYKSTQQDTYGKIVTWGTFTFAKQP